MSIFICHCNEDMGAYTALCGLLDARGLPRWDVSHMAPGESLAGQLRKAIKSCKVCVFVASERSVKSHWCMAEVGAFWGAGKPVIIFIADPNVRETDLPPEFHGELRTNDSVRVVDAASRCLNVDTGLQIHAEEVYSDVEHILSKLEREEEGRELSFKMRKELNLLHLGRKPVMKVSEVKDHLSQLTLYERHPDENQAFDESITSDFIEAVMDFQRREGLQQVDGIIGMYSKRRLKELTKPAKVPRTSG